MNQSSYEFDLFFGSQIRKMTNLRTVKFELLCAPLFSFLHASLSTCLKRILFSTQGDTDLSLSSLKANL